MAWTSGRQAPLAPDLLHSGGVQPPDPDRGGHCDRGRPRRLCSIRRGPRRPGPAGHRARVRTDPADRGVPTPQVPGGRRGGYRQTGRSGSEVGHRLGGPRRDRQARWAGQRGRDGRDQPVGHGPRTARVRARPGRLGRPTRRESHRRRPPRHEEGRPPDRALLSSRHAERHAGRTPPRHDREGPGRVRRPP